MKTKFSLLFIVFFSFFTANAEIKISALLGDNMVMQRNTEIKLWGKAQAGKKIVVFTSWNGNKTNTICNAKGEWLVKVKTTEAGGPYTISITSGKEKKLLRNILLGEVWLCSGQSNMEMPVAGFRDQPINGSNDALMDADNNNIRLFTVKRNANMMPQDTVLGSWDIASAVSVAQFSAVGYFYAKKLQQKLNIPIGMICSCWSGSRIEAWMSNETIIKYPEPYALTSTGEISVHNKASNLYNGMIAPIVNYIIKGVLWYQGESNILEYKDYSALMSGMVSNWRKDFGIGEFPFYFVQIAPFKYKNSSAITTALLRDEQLKASYIIPGSDIVCTMDIGDEQTIHPAEKEILGKRLACMALSETYKMKGINYKSPTFKNMTVKDSVAIISFDNIVMGLTSYGKEVESFQVAGEDKIFYPAKATISKSMVNVSAPQVKVPVAVRYGYCNFPKTNGFLFNTAGLPVPSFRTDKWEEDKL